MTTTNLLEWQYLIFLLPFGVSVLLLLLSSVRLGSHHSGAARGGHGRMPHAGHSHTHQGGGHKAHAARNGSGTRHGEKSRGSHEEFTPLSLLLGKAGASRAPLVMVVECFWLAWGVFGLAANQIFFPHNLASVLPSVAIAVGGGLLGARGAAELLGRFLPTEGTAAVSRDSLFGLTGKIVFPTGESGGRVRIYDEFGTIHDEPCCVATEGTLLEKGQSVLIVDKDAKGRLIVEARP